MGGGAGGRYEIHFRPLQSHSLDESCVFFFFFRFSPPFFLMLSQHISNVRPVCFVLFFVLCFFFSGFVFLPPPLGTHNAQLPLCGNISALLYTSIMWRFATATICHGPCKRTCRGNVFICTRVEPAEGVLSFLRTLRCHFGYGGSAICPVEAWKNPQARFRKTRFHSAESRRRPDLHCHSATCVCCSPANCLLLLWSRSLLIPAHDQERQLHSTDAEDHITCSYVTVMVIYVISQFAH